MNDRVPEISIVIPTYNERENIAAVVRDIFAVAVRQGYAIEVIIVDDNSPDGTGHEAEQLAKVFSVTVIHRRGKLGLGTAVVEGFARARGQIWGMMDGDRSHPAETLPDLIEPIRQGRCPLALASRYARGGAVEYWPGYRWVLSRAATLLGRLFARVRDPLSGFVFFDRSVVEGIAFTVRGYKIGLEILVKGRYDSLVEVPYTFRNREVGRSKLGWAEYINYLQSLVQLAAYVFRHRRERRARQQRARGEETGGARIEAALIENRKPTPCPLCGCEGARPLFVKNTYRYVRCEACRLVFVNPLPSAAELETIYADPMYFANRNEWAYGYNDYFGERNFYAALFGRRVRQIERALGVADGRGRRLCDVGCAAGFLLEAAAERGWDVAGVELSRQAADFANERLGDVVRQGTVEEVRFESESFDAVAMLDVVEHVADPLGLLREAARILKPGGVLLLSAPNVRSLSARLTGRRWFHFKRDHVVLFSGPTLLRAIEGAGLECFCLQRNGKMVSLNYLFARLKTYVPWLGKWLLGSLGRLGLCDRLFYDSWTGELLALCRKRDDSATARPSPNEVYGRFRARWWPPTALWRTAEYFRLHPIEGAPPVLDLGCGDGFFARQVFPIALRERIVGADFDLRELEALKKHDKNGQAVGAKARALPFRSGVFGFILANCSLEHVRDVDKALAEIARVLKPGGRLAFTVPSEHFGGSLFFSRLLASVGLRRAAQGYAALVNRILGHRNVLGPDEWRRLLYGAGLHLSRVDHFMPPALARAWDRRLWWGIPEFLIRRVLGRNACRRPFRRPPSARARNAPCCA